MNLEVKNILLRLLGLEFLSHKLSTLLSTILDRIGGVIHQKSKQLIIRGVSFFILLKMIGLAVLFFLLGLALYLNELLCSSYIGFLWVGVGCLVIFFLLLLIRSLYNK